jgi:hypothetical protein
MFQNIIGYFVEFGDVDILVNFSQQISSLFNMEGNCAKRRMGF